MPSAMPGGLTNFIVALKHSSSAGRMLRTQPVTRAGLETRGAGVVMENPLGIVVVLRSGDACVAVDAQRRARVCRARLAAAPQPRRGCRPYGFSRGAALIVFGWLSRAALVR